MAHTTLASTDRALEKIGEFVALQDYPSLKAVGRTFVQKAGVMVGLRRSIPKYNKKGKRRLAALELQARSLGSAAEPYLLLALREDSSQGVRGAAAQWLARIARHSEEDVRSRLYGVLVERHDGAEDLTLVRGGGSLNELHCIIFGALAERVAAAPGGSQLVEDLWNDFPHLMTSADDDAATMCGCFH